MDPVEDLTQLSALFGEAGRLEEVSDSRQSDEADHGGAAHVPGRWRVGRGQRDAGEAVVLGQGPP